MKNILQPTEARRIIEELLDYNNRKDLGIYIRGRESEFKEDRLFWVKLSDQLTRTTVIDEGVKWSIMNNYYHENDWNKDLLTEIEDRYIFLQEYFHSKVQQQLDDRKNSELTINVLPKLAIRYNNYINSSELRQKFYGINHLNEVQSVVYRSINNFLFDIEKHYISSNNTIALDTLLYVYFSENVLDALKTVGSNIKLYDVITDEVTKSTETIFEISNAKELYNIELTKGRKVYKQAFSRTYYEYFKRLSGKDKSFEAYKRWEIARWQLVLQHYSNNDWGYDIIKKYLDQIRRYTENDVVPLTPVHEHSFGIDKVYKPYIIKFFESIETRYHSETKSLYKDEEKKKNNDKKHIPIIHPDSTADDIATLLTANDFTQCKPVYFMCKGNVLAYLLHELYRKLRTPFMKTHINDVVESSEKIMYRKGIGKIENAKEIPRSEYSKMDRTKMYEGIKSFDKQQNPENDYESYIAPIVESVLSST